MPIRLSKMNTYISEGPKTGSVILTKVSTYISEGPKPGAIILTKVSTYISEGPRFAKIGRRLIKNLFQFLP